MRTSLVILFLGAALALLATSCKSDCERAFEAAEWCATGPLDKQKFLELCAKRPKLTKCANEVGCEPIKTCMQKAK